jgi:hypothetical protein
LTYFDKKQELMDVYCKDFMRHFLHGIYGAGIDAVLNTADGVKVDRVWDVESCPRLGCDYFHNRYHNVERYAKVHKEMYASMEALGWF